MCSGPVKLSQALAIGALTVVLTVIGVSAVSMILIVLLLACFIVDCDVKVRRRDYLPKGDLRHFEGGSGFSEFKN